MEFTALHLFSGIGGGALGFQQARSEFAGKLGRIRNLCGIDVDEEACQDFRRITGTRAEQLDLFSYEDYIAFHGKEPPNNWREIQPFDIREAMNGEAPDIIFTSPPCKGFSGLLPTKSAVTDKYQALNRLTVRGLRLAVEAFADDPPSLIIFENVPRIQSRGDALLSEIQTMLKKYGYVFHFANHDCGELGGLAQHRRRFLMIARHEQKMANFVYKPAKRRVRAIGEVIGSLPMPDDIERGGKMHRLPRLAWKTWMRLALIPAGGDWRDLQKIDHTQYRLEYEPRKGAMSVQRWTEPSGTVTGASGFGRSNAPQAIADLRLTGVQLDQAIIGNSCACDANEPSHRHTSHYRVTDWEKTSGTVTGASHVANGRVSVADPRVSDLPQRFPGKWAVQGWNATSSTITGSADIQSGAPSISDPRVKAQGQPGGYGVLDWDHAAPTIRGAARIMNSQSSIADPRISCTPRSGTYGVQAWDEPGKTVTASGDVHAGTSAVADPRIPADTENGVWVIIAEDGTWHRPLTTYELAMLQGFPTHMPKYQLECSATGFQTLGNTLDQMVPFELVGKSEARWRERIGNAVPAPAARAVGEVAITALMAAQEGLWLMAAEEIWVAPPDEVIEIEMVQ